MNANKELAISLLGEGTKSTSATGKVTLDITAKAWDSLHRIAEEEETSVPALLQGYIGRGLSEDMDNLFGSRLLAVIESLLEPIVESNDEIEAILAELKKPASPDPGASR